MARIILFAPNVHIGGGLVLLLPIIDSLRGSNALMILDWRVKSHYRDIDKQLTMLVRPTIYSRLKAEFKLRRVSTDADIILCFHSLPPILTTKSTIYIYLHNKHFLFTPLWKHHATGAKVWLRILFEKIVLIIFYHRAKKIIVQTNSMKIIASTLFDNTVPIDVFPYAELNKSNIETSMKKNDFIYISHGSKHKNHSNLILAWVLLAKRGIYPRLTLTINETETNIMDLLYSSVAEFDVKIETIGFLNHSEIYKECSMSCALIFPSFTESFGLPLIEADSLGLPIIAPELDYVRDVCRPVETFDPHSPISIMRAVLRFMDIKEELPKIGSPDEFVEYLRGDL